VRSDAEEVRGFDLRLPIILVVLAATVVVGLRVSLDADVRWAALPLAGVVLALLVANVRREGAFARAVSARTARFADVARALGGQATRLGDEEVAGVELDGRRAVLRVWAEPTRAPAFDALLYRVSARPPGARVAETVVLQRGEPLPSWLDPEAAKSLRLLFDEQHARMVRLDPVGVMVREPARAALLDPPRQRRVG
jgi:hypothetical protein